MLKQMIVFRSRVGRPINHVIIQPFADAVPVQTDGHDDTANRFGGLRSVVEKLEVPGPGIPVMPCANDPAWDRWTVEGMDKYWEIDDYAEVFYSKPWGR